MTTPKNISDHITYKEAIKSRAATRNGLDNTPDMEQLRRMILAAEHIFEPPRRFFGVRCHIASFYRSPRVNSMVGGSPISNHILGAAIDMDRDPYAHELFAGMPVTNKMWFEYIYWNCEFRELVWEYGDKTNPEWVHAAYRRGENIKLCKLKKPGETTIVFDPVKEGYISAEKPSYL